MKKIKRAIIKTGEQNSFLPLSDRIPKELFNLVDMPLMVELVDEALSINAEKIIFLSPKKSKSTLNFFENLKEIEDFLKKKGHTQAKKAQNLRKKYENIEFGFEKKLIKAIEEKENFSFLSADNLIDFKKSGLSQIMDIFKTSERPVLGLTEKEIGDLKTEKIARRLFKIKSFSDEATFSFFGRAIFTGESVKFFKGKKSLTEAIEEMLKRGHTIYGTLLKGDLFEVTDYPGFLKAGIHYGLKSEYGPELSEFIKEKI